MDFVRSFVVGTAVYDASLVPLFVIFLTAEALLPRTRNGSSALDRLKIATPAALKSAAFWLAFTPFTVAIGLAFLGTWLRLGVRPVLPDLAPPGLSRPLAAVIGALAAAFVGDFFYYWCHHAQHRFFWRFHAVHHSVRRMSGVSAWHHVSEELFKVALYAAPLGLITTDPYAIPVLGVLIGFQGNYLHSPARIHLGPLGRVIQDNRFHRIHHSIEPRHFDRNFGVFCTLWDQVFGTAYVPARDEWPETGVADMPEPTTLRAYLLAPWRSVGRSQGAPELEPRVKAAR